MNNEKKGDICPVCKKHIFSEHASYEICPICGWEDDAVAARHPDLEGGANGMSLNEYKRRAVEAGVITTDNE